MKYLMCNLKSNKTAKEMLEYKKKLSNLTHLETELVIFPSSLFISFFYDVAYKIGCQNISTYKEGSYTGEILASQLKELKVSYCLVNHAERKEKTEQVIQKIKNATNENIKVVLCFGEEKNARTEEVVKILILKLNDIYINLSKKEKENIILAYEPIWAIQNNVTINPLNIKTICGYLKQYIKETYNIKNPIIYGGSINTTNIQSLAEIDILDGYLIGNCTNNPDNVLKILEKI